MSDIHIWSREKAEKIIEEPQESSKSAERVGYTPEQQDVIMPAGIPAINVIKECADVYYASLNELPDDLKKQISCYMLDNIFRLMVMPTIDKARKLDRAE